MFYLLTYLLTLHRSLAVLRDGIHSVVGHGCVSAHTNSTTTSPETFRLRDEKYLRLEILFWSRRAVRSSLRKSTSPVEVWVPSEVRAGPRGCSRWGSRHDARGARVSKKLINKT